MSHSGFGVRHFLDCDISPKKPRFAPPNFFGSHFFAAKFFSICQKQMSQAGSGVRHFPPEVAMRPVKSLLNRIQPQCIRTIIPVSENVKSLKMLEKFLELTSLS
jgi:hypothetical protein